jgi:hypothetical protein
MPVHLVKPFPDPPEPFGNPVKDTVKRICDPEDQPAGLLTNLYKKLYSRAHRIPAVLTAACDLDVISSIFVKIRA